MPKFKTENGVEYPAAAFAYVPNGSVPSSWKLRLWEDLEKKTTAAQVGRAVAAIGKGFRGEKVQIPPKDRPAVLMRIKAAWKKVNDAGKELPDVLKKKTFAVEDDVNEYFGMEQPTVPSLETGESDFHVHMFSPVAEYTDVPRGLYKGHRHEITHDADGMVTGFGEAAGHTHMLPEYAEGFLSEVQPFWEFAQSRHGKGSSRGGQFKGKGGGGGGIGKITSGGVRGDIGNSSRILGKAESGGDPDIDGAGGFASEARGKLKQQLDHNSRSGVPDADDIQRVSRADTLLGEVQLDVIHMQSGMMAPGSDEYKKVAGKALGRFKEAKKEVGSLTPGFWTSKNAADDEHFDYADSDLRSVKGVEIFKIGKWNGDKYVEKDIDDIVDAFDGVGFQVPVKLGHSKEVGEPAFGWVQRVYRKGEVLLADFKDLPKKLYDAIKDRRFDAVSSEIFWNLERDGKKFRRVLKAVALLGSETPAVSGLAPLRTVVNSDLPPEDGFGRVGVYSFELKEEGEDMDKFEELQALAKKLEQNLETATSALAVAETKAEEAVGEAKAIADAELAETQEQIKKLEADLASAKEEVDKLAGEQGKEVAALTEQVTALTGQLAEMSEERRQRTIEEKAGKFPVPSLKRFMAPLYDIATSTSREVEFVAKDGEEPAKQSMEHILDAMAGFFTENAEKIFRSKSPVGHAYSENGSEDLTGFVGDPSVEVDKQARAYMDEHDKVSYPDAVQYVLRNDAELNMAYTAFSSSGSAH